VACSRVTDDGYATPAALVFSLALTMVVTATLARSVRLLKQANADFARTQAEYGLDGAQLLAAAEIIRSGRGGPYRWQFSTSLGWINAQAEPEAVKLTPVVASGLGAEVFARMGVRDVAALKTRLAALPDDPTVDVAALDNAVLWRLCAPIMISGLGVAKAFAPPAWAEPGPGKQAADWHVGELWRIRVRTTAGWRDDRIVRFTGDARHPAATVMRRFSRGEGDWGRCDAVLAG